MTEPAPAKRDLPQEMRDRADHDQLPPDHQLRTLAAELEAAITGFYGTPQTHTAGQFVGAWARARRVWCQVTGEPLI